MTNLEVINRVTGINVTYPLNDIRDIDNGKLKDFYSKEDIEANDMKPNDSCIKINFKNGEKSSFGKDWFICFA